MSNRKNYRGSQGKVVWENTNFRKGVNHTDEPLREGTARSLVNFDVSKTGGTLEVRDPFYSPAFKLPDQDFPQGLNKDSFLFKPIQDSSKNFIISIGEERSEIGYKELRYSNVVKGPPSNLIEDDDIRVIDGDTIAHKRIRYRLLGIDAQELNEPWDYQYDPPTIQLTEWLQNADEVYVVYDKRSPSSIDVYNRHLVWIYAKIAGELKNLNMELYDEFRSENQVMLMGGFDDDLESYYLPNYRGIEGTEFEFDIQSHINKNDPEASVILYDKIPKSFNIYSKDLVTKLNAYEEPGKVKVPVVPLETDNLHMNMSQVYEDLKLNHGVPLEISLNNKIYQEDEYRTEYKPWTRLDELDAMVFLGTIKAQGEIVYQGMISVQYHVPLEDNIPRFDNASFTIKTYKNNVFKVRFEELNNRYNMNLLDPNIPGRRDFIGKEAEENRYYTYLLPTIGVLNEDGDFVTQVAQGREYTIRPYYVLPEIDENENFDGYAVKWDFYTNDNYLRNKNMMTYPSFDDFPENGRADTIYVDTSDSNQHYRWDGNDYVSQETPDPVVSTGWQINFDKQGKPIETFNQYYENKTYRKLTPKTEGGKEVFNIVNVGETETESSDQSEPIVCNSSSDVGKTGKVCFPDPHNHGDYICREVECVSEYIEETFHGFEKSYEEISEETYDMHELSFNEQKIAHNSISKIYYSDSIPYNGSSKVKLYLRTGADFEIYREQFTDIDLNHPNLIEVSRQISIQFGNSRNRRLIVTANINNKQEVEIDIPEEYRDQSTMRVVDVAIAGDYYNESLGRWEWYDLTKEQSEGLYAYLHEIKDDPEPIRVAEDYRNLLSVTTDHELFQKAKKDSHGNVYALVYLSRVTVENGRHVQTDLELDVTARINSVIIQVRDQEELETQYQHGQNLGACESITSYKGQLVLYGNPNASNVLYMSDVGGNITYFPFRRALDQFYSDIVHVEPVKQGLIVFTTNDIYLVYEVEDEEGNIHFMASVVYSNLTIQPHNRNTVRAAGKDIVFMAKEQVLMLRPNPYVEDVTDMFLEDISTGIKELIENPREFIQERLLHYKEPATPIFQETNEPIYETKPIYKFNFNKPIYNLKKKIKIKHSIEVQHIEFDKEYVGFHVELYPMRHAIFSKKVYVVDPDNVYIRASQGIKYRLHYDVRPPARLLSEGILKPKLNYQENPARVITVNEDLIPNISFRVNQSLNLEASSHIDSHLTSSENEASVAKFLEDLKSSITVRTNQGLSVSSEEILLSDIRFEVGPVVRVGSKEYIDSEISYDYNTAYTIGSEEQLLTNIHYDINHSVNLYATNKTKSLLPRISYQDNESLFIVNKNDIKADLGYTINQPINLVSKEEMVSKIRITTDQPSIVESSEYLKSDIDYDWNPPRYIVRFYDHEGLWASETVYHGEDASDPGEPSRSGTGYVFDGWDQSLTNITEDKDIVATWSTTTHPRPTVSTGNPSEPWTMVRFIVNNNNSSGHLGAELRIRHPITGSWFSAFTSSTQRNYARTYTGLDPDTEYEIRAYNRSTVDGYNNSSYRTYSAKTDPIPVYTVTFYDFDDNVISTQDVEHGDNASAPSSPSTGSSHTYFDGWDRSFTNITSNTHVLPTYSYYTYTMRWEDYDGSLVRQRTINSGTWMSTSHSDWPSHPNSRSAYDPDGWSNTGFTLTSNTTVTAEYKIKTYTVNFRDFDQNIIKSQTVNHGSNASPPSAPSTGNSCTYFDGWDRSYTNVTSNLNVYPTYEYYQKTVTWENYDGSQIKQVTVNCSYYMSTSGTHWPSHPDNKSGYEADGWSHNSFNVVEDTTVVAEYKELIYRVRFYGYDNQTILHEEYVQHGQDATPPSDPETPNSYTYFDGWDKSYTNITSQTYLYAQYDYHYYTVRWQDFNGAQVYQRSVRGGTYMNSAYEHWPEHPDSRNDYIPDGWSPIGFTLTGTELIVAQYKYKYTVEWQDNSNVGSSEYNSTDNVCSEIHHEGNVTRDMRWSETGNVESSDPGGHVANNLPNPNNYDPGYIVWLRDTSQVLTVYREYEAEIRAYRKCTKVEI